MLKFASFEYAATGCKNKYFSNGFHDYIPDRFMSFVYPYVLWALTAIAIPVIIHLFNFRKHKKIYFTNVKYIQELKQQTRRQSRLRHLLVLLSRILAIACLVLAFAQPYIPASEGPGTVQALNAVSIYIDNSFSMESEATDGPLLELAKNRAAAIASAYKPSDKFQLLTNDFEGRHQRLTSYEEFMEMLQEVKLSPSVQPLSGVLLRQEEALNNNPSARRARYVISDFQKSTSDFTSLRSDSLTVTYMVPVSPEKASNLYIDSCWFESPVHQLGQAVKLLARIQNDSEEGFEKLPVKFTVNGLQKALASFDIGAGATAVIVLPFTSQEPGIQFGKLEISDFPVTFDDVFYLVYEVQEALPVLNIYGDNPSVFLNSLLGSDSAFAYCSVSYKNIDYDEMPNHSLIILDGLPSVPSGLLRTLTEFTANGGSILLIPGPEIEPESYRDLSQALGIGMYREQVQATVMVSSLDLKHPVFLDVFEDGKIAGKDPDSPVDLPRILKYYPIVSPSGAFKISLIKMMNQDDLLQAFRSGDGMVYQLAVSLQDDFSNFQRHALFVPVIYRIAFLSGATYPLAYTMGASTSITVENAKIEGDEVLKIESLDGSLEMIPGQRNSGSSVNLTLHGQPGQDGHYSLVSGDKVIRGIALNYDRRESALSFYSAEEVSVRLTDNGLDGFYLLQGNAVALGESIEALSQGQKLWKLFIIFALFFLAIEVILLRVWSKN